MTQKILRFVNYSIFTLYLGLAVVTPLLFSTQTSELFEVPKMLFVYFLTVIIATLTIIKAVLEKKQQLAINPITISFLVFIVIQIVSTITSIDKFTSVFGYPTRLNGSLLSQFAYFTILICALVNISIENAKKLLVTIVIAAFIVALWGIPSHFGYDPNCLILTGQLNANCWQIDFNPTLRIFSTMGQPDWLASFFILIIPPSIALAIATKNQRQKYFFAITTLCMFIALMFTNSIAGIAGLIVAIGTFILLIGKDKIFKNSKIFLLLAIPVILTAAIFGHSLVARINEALKPQSESGPTSSARIRLIVWQGALQVIKHHPLLGTGPETFAYSYYMFRPTAHNQTSEWNFFYNKAHNEILNTFANVGILGGISFLIFMFLIVKTLLGENQLISKATVAAIIGYEVSILFGFSTVATQLVMFLEIAIILIINKQNKTTILNFKFLTKPLQIVSLGIVFVAGIYGMFFVVRMFLADTFTTKANGVNSAQSLLLYSNAIAIFPAPNPFYLSDAAYLFAQAATGQEDKELANSLTTQAENLAKKSSHFSPKNVMLARKAASTFILLSQINPKDANEALNEGLTVVNLAPTDPQSYLTLAKTQINSGNNDDAKKSIQKALELKPDYVEAQQLLDQLTTKQ